MLAALLAQQTDNLPATDGIWEDDTEQISMQELKEQNGNIDGDMLCSTASMTSALQR